MEKNDFLKDVIEKVDDILLEGKNLLVVVESTISSIQLGGILNKNDSSSSNFLKTIDEVDKILIKVSDDVSDRFKSKIGRKIIYGEFGQVTSIYNKNDEHDFKNVIENYKFDSKSSLPKQGISYKVRLYYIVQSEFVLATQSVE